MNQHSEKNFSSLDRKIQKRIFGAQKNEITEHHVYMKLSKVVGKNNPKNAEILTAIGKDEKTHYKKWKNITNRDIKPSKLKIFFYRIISVLFGLTFGLKLMEKGEKSAQKNYRDIIKYYPEIADIIEDEDRHEHALLNMLDEEHLQYVGSIVLGLNDALVELTGALAGLTLALQKTRLIAITAFITGIAASFSMAASEYLSTKAETSAGSQEKKSPYKASLYTGIAYVVTVVILILPYLFLQNYLLCLGISIGAAIFIIFFFNFYISVAKDLSFKNRFAEMVFISLGIAGLSFGIGFLVRILFKVEI